MSQFPITIQPFGEQAVLIQWPEEVREPLLFDVLRFTAYLKEQCLDNHSWEFVPAYHTLALIRREGIPDFGKIKRQLLGWYPEASNMPLPKRNLWKLPVCYDPDFGIDMEEVSNRLHLSVWEVIRLHTESVYTVYGIGFLPGFMYLGGLPSELEIPRRETPRMEVAAGAVGLAGKQTGIYPQPSPGGWNIIGNCPIPMFNASKDPPVAIQVGDQVQFYGISHKEYELITIQNEVGIFAIEKIPLHAEG